MELFYLNIDNHSFEEISKHRRQHYLGRYLLEKAAKNIFQIKNTEIEIINKKPTFKYSKINFSISHSHNIAAVCFSENNVGFDIEKILPRNFNQLAKRMNFGDNVNTSDEFYTLWTLYEAEIKLQDEPVFKYSGKFTDDYIFSIVSDKKFKLNCIYELIQTEEFIKKDLLQF